MCSDPIAAESGEASLRAGESVVAGCTGQPGGSSSSVVSNLQGNDHLTRLLAGWIPLALHGAALLVSLLPVEFAGTGWTWGLLVLSLPTIYMFSLVTLAGGFARIFASDIVPGRFPRDARDPRYRARLLYGAAWTAVFYCKPVFHGLLLFHPLKVWAFRLFGYRGIVSFTAYPDTWIRDLPLLDFGKGVYISNRATIGSNIVQADGRILVGRICLGDGVLVGHLAAVSPDCSVGARTQIGFKASLGIGVQTEDDVYIGPLTIVNHGAIIQRGARLGTACLIGRKSVIGPGLRVPDGTVIPDRCRVLSEGDLRNMARRRDQGIPAHDAPGFTSCPVDAGLATSP